MTEAEYCTELDAWFIANRHPIRCAALHPSTWQTFHKQGLAPSVAGARIVASAPRGASFAAPAPGHAPGPQANPQPGSPFPPQPFGFQDVANARFVRLAAKILFGLGLAQAILFGFVAVVLFVLALAAYNQTVRPDDSQAARAGATMGFFAIMAPVGGMFGIAIAGLVLATFGQLAIMAADFHRKHLGTP